MMQGTYYLQWIGDIKMKSIIFDSSYQSFETVFGETLEDFKQYNDIVDDIDEFDLVHDQINIQHSDLVDSLKGLKSNGLIGIASIGTWQGTRYGYVEYNDLVDLAYCDYELTLEADRYNIFRRETHHDGTNYIEVREWRDDMEFEQREAFMSHLYNGTATRNIINYYTQSVRPLLIESLYEGV